MFRRPIYSFRKRIWLMIRGFFRKGSATWSERVASMRQIIGYVFSVQSQTDKGRDPLVRTRQALVQKDARRLEEMETSINREIQQVVAAALQSERSAS